MPETDLAAIEEIKRLKARYFRLLDTKQWDAWRELFSDDFGAEIHGPHPVIRFASADEMVDANRRLLAKAVTIHHGYMPEIEVMAPDRASGVWAMRDVVRLGEGFVGYGHYHEDYRRERGEWRIAHLRLTRLWIDRGAPPASA